MKKVSFVILHYSALKDTIECVQSILNNVDYDNYTIIIVDNNSPNNSGLELKKMFLNYAEIKVILAKENLGFAKGNNLGYTYGKEKLKSDFIFLINNDTIIKQPNFVNLAIETFDRTHYYVLGPDILSIQGEEYHQSPSRLKGLTKEEVKYLIKQTDYMYIKAYFKYVTHSQKLINALKKKLGITLNSGINSTNENKVMTELEDVQLHGACIILSSLYIGYFDCAFFPRTYMYMEEDILYYLCRKNNFKIIFNPQMQIMHKEDASTDSIMNSQIKKTLFILKHTRNSARILYDLMDTYQ